MNILITGVGPHNKGAELMLLAILDQLKRHLPEARVVVPPTCGPYEWRARYGLFQLLDSTMLGRLGWLRRTLLHQGYRSRFGLVLPEQIDVVLDASGYAFGDAWKPEWVEGAAKQFERYKREGARIVILPQAFGPFSNTRVRTASARALDAADLVFARDRESLACCADLAAEKSNIHCAPDFTILLDGCLPDSWAHDERNVALVPNRKMLSHPDAVVADSYMPAMASVLTQVASSGYRPFVLIHEQNDGDLAKDIVDVSGIDCTIVNEANPLVIKGIAGACAFTIGSRFHGLVNALSQGVPSIATSWSHKYQHLYFDYGLDTALCWAGEDMGELKRLVACLLDSDQRLSLQSTIQKGRNRIVRESKAMWELVLRTIKNDNPTTR